MFLICSSLTTLSLFVFPQQVSQEGESFSVPIPVAKLSELVKSTIDEDEDEGGQEIPIPNVKAAVLSKVLEYCTHYQQEEMTPIETPLNSSNIEDLVQPWYADYVEVEQSMLFELVTAANFMDIKPLLDLTCLAVSIYIKVCPCHKQKLCAPDHLFNSLTFAILFLSFTGQVGRRIASDVQH